MLGPDPAYQGYYQKKKKKNPQISSVGEDVEKGNPCSLLMGM